MIKDMIAKLDRRAAVLGLSFLLILVVVEIAATVSLPEFRKFFYNVLEQRDFSRFYDSIFYFLVVIGALTFAQSLKQYVARTTALHFRTALTKLLQKKWVSNKEYARVDNPCQRINEDCKIATDLVAKVAVEIAISSAIVVILIIDSYQNSNIVLAAISYTVAVSVAAMVFRRGLTDQEIVLQKAEANHRFSLAQITMNVGDNTSKAKYLLVCGAVRSYLKTVLRFTVFSHSQNNFSIIVPWILLSSAYFSSQISLGEFMGSVAIFELIVVNATILIQLFPEVTKAHASWIRISEFYNVL